MDTILLDMLVEATRDGKKSGAKWSSDVWTSMKPTFSKKAYEEFQSCRIENRINLTNIS